MAIYFNHFDHESDILRRVTNHNASYFHSLSFFGIDIKGKYISWHISFLQKKAHARLAVFKWYHPSSPLHSVYWVITMILSQVNGSSDSLWQYAYSQHFSWQISTKDDSCKIVLWLSVIHSRLNHRYCYETSPSKLCISDSGKLQVRAWGMNQVHVILIAPCATRIDANYY
jgi:hypothetical protein